jgi:hypothetical protein
MPPKQRRTLGRVALVSVVWIASWYTAPAAATDPKPDHVFDNGVGVYFLGKDDGAKAIVEDGEGGFFDRLTPLDMALRLGRDLKSEDVEAERARFKKFVARNVREWTPAEKKKLLAAVKSAHGMCEESLPELLPDAWRFIKTSGDAEGAPHTRGSAVVLPAGQLASGVSEHMLIHELFHLYSRVHPAKRRELYQTLGFRELPSVSVPPALQRKRITNPDGADINYAITVTAGGRKVDVVPIVYSRYDQRRDDLKGLFAYVAFGLFEVREANGEWSVAVDERGEPLAPQPPTVDGFFQQIGRNTRYIIHPDEILADNVAMLVTASADKGAGRIATPDLLDRIKQVIQAGKPE